jgi:hypothetical protein
MAAQGIALGPTRLRVWPCKSETLLVTPFQGWRLFYRSPRATPWAVISRPGGACAFANSAVSGGSESCSKCGDTLTENALNPLFKLRHPELVEGSVPCAPAWREPHLEGASSENARRFGRAGGTDPSTPPAGCAQDDGFSSQFRLKCSHPELVEGSVQPFPVRAPHLASRLNRWKPLPPYPSNFPGNRVA